VIDIPETAQRNIAALFEMEGRGLAMLVFGDEGGLLTITCDGELFLARRLDITLGQLQDADENLRQQYLDRVELEVQRSLDYFDRQFHHIPVNRLILSRRNHWAWTKFWRAAWVFGGDAGLGTGDGHHRHTGIIG